MAALASLTADYNDSEEETEASSPTKEINNDDKEDVDDSSSRGLVSYGEPRQDKPDGSIVEEQQRQEEGGKDAVDQSVPMELDSDNDGDDNAKEDAEDDEKDVSREPVLLESWSEGEQLLPAEPEGACDSRLQAKIAHLMSEKERKGMDINKMIQNKKSFRNPSIYEKLIQFCGIDEHGTNLPKELYDGHLFGPESYYEELAKVQASDMERREKAMQMANKAKQNVVQRQDEGTKRRSKWDQINAANRVATTSAGQKVHVPPPTVVSAGAKSIPAFGPLKK